MQKSRRRIWILVLYVILIFIVSSIPTLTSPGPRFALKDKLYHLLEYFVLGVLLFRAIGYRVGRSRTVAFSFLLAAGASVGALDEIYQSFIPGRSMTILDWYADVIGVALGAGLFVFSALGGGRRQEGAETAPAGAGGGRPR